MTGLTSPTKLASPSQSSVLDDGILSVCGQRWVWRDLPPQTAFSIAADHKLDETIAHILAARGVTTDNAERYIRPTLRHDLPDPSVLTDMEQAAACFADEIMASRTIGVFGDYDVDGVTASSLIALYLTELNAPYTVYLPDRVADGYGPSVAAFQTLAERGASLIVTVDCGAAAHEPIAEAGAAGLKIVVLDHHQMTDPPPAEAVAVVNPNRPDDVSGLTGLSAAGVTFMFLVAVNRTLRARGWFENRPEPNLLKWLDVVALGLVCDVMPVTGLTRTLIAQGLKLLSQGGNPGLGALGDVAGVRGRASTYHLGFLLGPRINAAGRIGHADLAFRLLTAQDSDERKALADQLHRMNAERQAIEAHVLEEAIAMVEARTNLPPVIVAAHEGWHPGVIGIVAGRLKEQFNRPAVVIGLDKGVGKGSGRSLSGVDLGSAISAARDAGLLVAGGGHAMAAGLTINADQLPDFEAFMVNALEADVVTALANRALKLDASIALTAVSGRFATMIEAVGPYGPGNPEPVFALEDVRIAYPKTVGQDHLACVIENDQGEQARAIAFRAGANGLGAALTKAARENNRISLAGRIKVDDWRGNGAGQFQIVDARIST